MFYFSLKCGLLYDYVREWDQFKKLNSLFLSLSKLKKENPNSLKDEQIIDGILESIRVRKGLKKDDLSKIKDMNGLLAELSNESQDHLKRVGHTFAGIEIVHFCVNEEMRDYWSRTVVGNNKLGVVVFWHFIVPIILKVMDFVGCEFLFLFAADFTPDQFLVNYYKALGFKDSSEHATAISFYDFACKFMYQKTCGLERGQQNFYTYFNADVDDV